MNIMKILSHHTRDADNKSLQNIYKSLILSQINYGLIIYRTEKKY